MTVIYLFIYILVPGLHLCPGGSWDGASVQSSLCSQRPGCAKLSDKQSETHQSVITEPEQRRLQQVCQKKIFNYFQTVNVLTRQVHMFSLILLSFLLCAVCVRLCSEYYHYRQAWIPLRWLPSESVFEDDFSTKSDVWAFGVLMWEVFSHGEMPHSKLSDDEVLEGQYLSMADQALNKVRECLT